MLIPYEFIQIEATVISVCSRFSGLEQWTNELEDLANQLSSESLAVGESLMDSEVAAEIARRYRTMLEKFEKMVDSTGTNISLAERLNRVLQELISGGGLSPSQMAQRRNSLARVLNSLHDIDAMAPNLLQTGEK